MDKWKDLLLILLVVAVLIILLRMSKIMQMQNSTLLSVANKLGIESPGKDENTEDIDHKEVGETEEEEEESEEESEEEIEEKEEKTTTIKVTKPKKEPTESGIKRTEVFALVLDTFKDGIPKKRKEIEELTPNFPGRDSKGKGYLGNVIRIMNEKGMLGSEFVDLGDKWKSYYIFGLPDWFENGVLKHEYAKKIELTNESKKEENIETAEATEEENTESES